MGIGRIHARDLDRLVAEVDARNGLGSAETGQLLADFEIAFDTRPDITLDPFSDAYFAHQQALYVELAGRPVDQRTGEITPLDPTNYTNGPNPYCSTDIGFIARNARAIQTCLIMADLPPGASVLDAGSGWGLSSEMMAFSGAKVTAVDINPMFAELVRLRAARLGLPIASVVSTFDEFDTPERFDLLFFYECLHHSLRPWQTLARLGGFVKPGGKIMLAGEPIQSNWWPNWGLRLDAASIYCIRKFGWWESGWSAPFLVAAFAHAGFRLDLHPHVGLDNGLIGVAVRQTERDTAKVNLTVCAPYREAEARVAAAQHATAAERAAREGDRAKAANTAELTALRAEVDALRTAAEGTAAETAALRAEVNKLRTSRSWRYTAPMRLVFRKFGFSQE